MADQLPAIASGSSTHRRACRQRKEAAYSSCANPNSKHSRQRQIRRIRVARERRGWEHDELWGRMEVALNEADVVGIRMGNAPAVVDVLLHVLALPPEGPIDPDPRRVLQLHGVGELLVLLRHDSAIDGYGPPQPLRDLDAVEEFFASLSRVDAIARVALLR